MTDARPSWVPDTVFYQIFPDRFCNGDSSNDPAGSEPWGSTPTRENFMGGDLAGITKGLPYLRDLGISGLYLTPIFEADTNHRYDTRDYLKVDPALGDEADAIDMVSSAHAHGIRVLFDGVFNHAGDGFWAFRDVIARGAASPYASWFFARDYPIVQDPPNYQTCGGAPFLPKLNVDDPGLRTHLLQVATFWIERAGIDGWRLDVPWKANREFWDKFVPAVKAARDDAYLVGEIWRDPREWEHLFDGTMNYRYRDAMLDYCLRDAMDAEDFRYETDRLFVDPAAPWRLNLLGSHDTPRLLTLAGGNVERALVAFTALFVAPGAPMLYYGDEIGLEGENDPGCRGCMIWDRTTWNHTIHRRIRRLIALRHTLPALRHGTWEPLLTFNGVLAVRRQHESGDAVIVLNPRHAQSDLRVPLPGDAGAWEDELSGQHFEACNGTLTLPHLPACSALILTKAATA
jgi:glycosidase